jgi:hypothetical protein
VPKTRPIIILAFSLAVLLGTACGGYNPPVVYRIVLPDNYIGWLRVDFGISSAPEWRFYQLATTVTIPETGVEQTQYEMFRLNGKEQVFLYYRRGGELVRVPDELYAHPLVPNYVFEPRKRKSHTIRKGSWYIFVGPPSLRGQYSPKAVWEPRDRVPTPGRMDIPSQKTQSPAEPNR